MPRNTITDPFEAISQALAIEPEELLTLREQAAADPVRGAPKIRDDGSEIEPGDWRFEAEPDGLPPDCPVRPLGMDALTAWFLNPMGQVVPLTASASGKGPIDFLFAGRTNFLEWAWPRWSAGGEKKAPEVKGYEADEARRDLVNAAAWMGVFNDLERLRGRGAWTDAAGRLIYHAGDRVWVGGRWRAPGEHGDWVFPARTPVMTPWHDAVRDGTGGPADVVIETLRTWNWQRGELDARLLLGWICAAMLGGALHWRPMVFLTGDQATGKSTLQDLIKALLGGLLVHSTNTTAAGIYQKVQHDSAPVSVDELEAEADTRRADDVVKLARIAASGGLLLRGGSDHNGKEFQARSAFVFSAINMPPLSMQDQSRIAVLALRPLTNDAVDTPLPENPGELGRQLLKRMFDAWARWPAVLRAFRKAMMEAGQGGRAADQFGTLAAAYHVAMYDEPPSKTQLEEWMGWLNADALIETAAHVPNWRQCLNHLVEVQPQVLSHYASKSLGAAISLYKAKNTDCDLERVAQTLGLAVSWPKGEVEGWDTVRLFVPSTHPVVMKLFEGTQWAGRAGATGVWASALRQAPEDVVQAGKCDKGLDKKRAGVFVALARFFED